MKIKKISIIFIYAFKVNLKTSINLFVDVPRAEEETS